MSAKIQGGSVFPTPRLSPSGPLLSGEGGPIVQIKFNQLFTKLGGAPTEWDVPVVPFPPSEADIKGSTIPNDTATPAGDILAVTLTNVKKDNLVAVWFSFGVSLEDGDSVDAPADVLFAILFDDGEGNDTGAIDGANQNVVLIPLGEAEVAQELGSILWMGPNPFGATRNVRLFPVAFRIDTNGGVAFLAPANQVSILAAEIAKT